MRQALTTAGRRSCKRVRKPTHSTKEQPRSTPVIVFDELLRHTDRALALRKLPRSQELSLSVMQIYAERDQTYFLAQRISCMLLRITRQGVVVSMG